MGCMSDKAKSKPIIKTSVVMPNNDDLEES